jgi:hypothetical protein
MLSVKSPVQPLGGGKILDLLADFIGRFVRAVFKSVVGLFRYSLAAVALIATTTFAIAEPTDQNGKGSGAANSAAEHSPDQMKGSKFAPGQLKDGGSAKELSPSHMKEGSISPNEQKSRGDRKSENHEGSKSKDNARNDSDLGSKGHDPDQTANDRELKGSDRDRSARDERGGDRDRNAKDEGRDRDRSATDQRLGRDDKMGHEGSQVESARDRASTGTSAGTEGRSGARGSITEVTEEQRGRVKGVFVRHRVEPARDLGLSLNIGVALPRHVHLYAVPEDIVEIVPNYRGYEYIMLDDNRFAIVDPGTYEVVDIIVVG